MKRTEKRTDPYKWMMVVPASFVGAMLMVGAQAYFSIPPVLMWIIFIVVVLFIANKINALN